MFFKILKKFKNVQFSTYLLLLRCNASAHNFILQVFYATPLFSFFFRLVISLPSAFRFCGLILKNYNIHSFHSHCIEFNMMLYVQQHGSCCSFYRARCQVQGVVAFMISSIFHSFLLRFIFGSLWLICGLKI